jgi:BNR repeat-like domain
VGSNKALRRPGHAARRWLVVSVGVVGTALSGIGGLSGPVTAQAATKYYFHGLPGNGDDASRQLTPTATFDTTAPTNPAPSTQTSVPVFVPIPCGDSNYSYWQGTAFTGPLNGTLHIDWWWQTANAEALALGDVVDITVCADGNQVGSLSQVALPIGPTPTESTFDVPVSGTVNTTLLIQAAPHFLDTGQQNTVLYNSTSEPSFFTVSSGPPPTPTPSQTATATPTLGGQQGNQVFHNYQSPYPYPHEPPCANPPTCDQGPVLLFGEPSIGVDWGTTAAGSNLTMYQGDLNTWQIHFDYSVKPPTAVWDDRSDPATDVSSLDARLITDHAGLSSDRTFVEQLHTATSIQAYSNTDGGTSPPPSNAADWISSTSSLNGGVDHESIGAGRYSTVNAPANAGVLYPHAVYYCSQSGLNAFCIRSDDGGVTYGPPAQAIPTSCDSLHGKPRVGPDGVVYLPDKDCGAAGANKAVSISTDNGANWTIHNIPNTSTDCNQPDPDVAVGGGSGKGTVYYAYRDGDKKAKVVTSTDDGQSWSTPFDVGAAFGVQTAQFPEVIAGDANRAAVTFIGTQTSAPHTGCNQGDNQDDLSDNFGCPTNTSTNCGAVWHLYVAFTYDGGLTWQTVDATPNLPVQRGGVCMNGTGCSGNDRNMLDFNDETIDNHGRVQVAYTDGCTASCETSASAPTCNEGNQDCMGKFSSVFSMVDQVCGKGLFAAYDPGFFNDPSCAAPTNIPEVPIAAPLGVAGLVAAAIGVIFGRRRRRPNGDLV